MKSDREKRILIGVDGSEESEKAVRYVADFLGNLPGFLVILLHIIPSPAEDYFFTDEDLGKWVAERRTAAIGMMENYRRTLISSGVPEDEVTVMIETRYCPSVAECILDVQEKTDSCTIAIGRRNLSRREEILFGSTSEMLLHKEKNCAIWLI